MCLTRNWLPPHSTPSRSSAPNPLPKSRSIFASTKAMPANRLTAKPANAAIRLTFRARPTKSQSRSIVGKARRWKVERTHSWLNRARRLLIRWEKKVANYLGFLHLQFAIVALRTAKVLG